MKVENQAYFDAKRNSDNSILSKDTLLKDSLVRREDDTSGLSKISNKSKLKKDLTPIFREQGLSPYSKA